MTVYRMATLLGSDVSNADIKKSKGLTGATLEHIGVAPAVAKEFVAMVREQISVEDSRRGSKVIHEIVGFVDLCLSDTKAVSPQQVQNLVGCLSVSEANKTFIVDFFALATSLVDLSRDPNVLALVDASSKCKEVQTALQTAMMGGGADLRSLFGNVRLDAIESFLNYHKKDLESRIAEQVKKTTSQIGEAVKAMWSFLSPVKLADEAGMVRFIRREAGKITEQQKQLDRDVAKASKMFRTIGTTFEDEMPAQLSDAKQMIGYA
eukprot:11455677-Karenia_brevis.AAC.1